MWTARLHHLNRALGVFIQQPSDPPRRADSAVWRSYLDLLRLAEKLLAGFPHGFERLDEAQDRAVALEKGARHPIYRLIQGGEPGFGLRQTAI